jgi:hypothetical protein
MDATHHALSHDAILPCKDEESAKNCIAALQSMGLPGAKKHGAVLYEFGLEQDFKILVRVVEKWNKGEDLEEHLMINVVPNIEAYNVLLSAPSDPAKNTTRINLVN